MELISNTNSSPPELEFGIGIGSRYWDWREGRILFILIVGLIPIRRPVGRDPELVRGSLSAAFTEPRQQGTQNEERTA